MMDKLPTILVFDSGIGGISVYNEIRQKIPQANYIYLFDNQAFPYGDKSNQFLIERVKSVIDKAITLFPVDMVVIACNTASTICLPTLRAQATIPVVGVVPAIKPAIKITKNGCIGLLATKATVEREYTHNLIREFAEGYRIELLGLSELALIAEAKLQGIAVSLEYLTDLLRPWLELAVVPDTIVLGCTHYPFIQPELAKVLPAATFIDSGYAIASRVYDLLKARFDLSPRLSKPVISHNIMCSTQYNARVAKLVEMLQNYNFDKYQYIEL